MFSLQIVFKIATWTSERQKKWQAIALLLAMALNRAQFDKNLS